jgi:hypothetical protein
MLCSFSAFPDKSSFEYTFENISAYINRFTEQIDLSSFTIYLHDYGSSIGLRLCINHPEKIEGIIVQNGNAYMEGIGPQLFFSIEEASCYKRDLSNAQIHILDGGHWALETNFDEVLGLIDNFMSSKQKI